MNARPRTDLPSDVYPDEPWAIVEDGYAPRFTYLTEAIFALSNGHIGVRGTLDTGDPAHLHGTYVNGFHETWKIEHAESAYGLADKGQTMVNVPDGTTFDVVVNGERLVLDSARDLDMRRWLDFRTGILECITEWTVIDGTRVTMWTRRLVSYHLRDLAAIKLRIETDRPASVTVTSRMVNRQDLDPTRRGRAGDPRLGRAFKRRVLEPRAATLDGLRLAQAWVTRRRGAGLVTAADHLTEGVSAQRLERAADDFGFHLAGEVSPDTPFEVTKLLAYAVSNGAAGPDERTLVSDALDRGTELGFDGLARLQEQRLGEFWRTADIEVDAPGEVQRAIRWTLFQLFQATVCLLDASVPAKGLTGQAYDGHYFWDTEIYVVPFLVYSNPDKAAEVLRFRHRILPAARRRAAELSLQGALYPWRTISGEEASAYFPAGTAQFHIDADIIYALRKYVEVTGDEDLLWEIGVEMAVETARMWNDVGFHRDGEFHIHGVTGPDEYTALVDDNAYTNAMARMNLRFAADVVGRMASEHPEAFTELAERIDLDEHEAESWISAADAMYIPFDEELGITPQDDDFLSKEPWDFEGTPVSKYPLLLHFHPLTIYRYQVLKQADVVLLDFLLGDEFDAERKRRNFEYYDPLTTGDSSLSACVQSIIAAEVERLDLAYDYFQHALFMDLADLSGNTTDGVHMASAGGVWLAIIAGFGGMRDAGGTLRFDPHLPARWERLRFRLQVRGSLLEVTIQPSGTTFSVQGRPLDVIVGDERLTVEPD